MKQIKYESITNKDIENYIKQILIKYDFSIKELADLLDVNPNIIADYENEYKNISISNKRSFCDKLMIIYHIDSFLIDDRLKGLIDILNTKHNISINTISKLSGIELNYINDFIIEPDKVPYKIKYRLSIFVDMLYSFFNK